MKWILGNWKMHKTKREALSFLEKLQKSSIPSSRKVGLAVPFTSLESCTHASEGGPLWIGAQNMHEEQEGAFTGEVSVSMIEEAGAKFVLLGHSERRKLFEDTDAKIAKKVLLAIKKAIAPVLCVGETLQEREKDFRPVLRRQIEKGLELLPTYPESLFIAYEPVWAIGTGLSAKAEEAKEAHDWIYHILEEKWGAKARKTPLLYGGSVNEGNITSLLEKESIKGVLVGGASLNIDQFLNMIRL